jgi:hypothetical protein
MVGGEGSQIEWRGAGTDDSPAKTTFCAVSSEQEAVRAVVIAIQVDSDGCGVIASVTDRIPGATHSGRGDSSC